MGDRTCCGARGLRDLRAAVVAAGLLVCQAGCATTPPADGSPSSTAPPTPIVSVTEPIVSSTGSPATSPEFPIDAVSPTTAGGGLPRWFVPVSVAFSDADHGWLAGSAGGAGAFVIETKDGGLSWTTTQVGTWVALAVAIGPDGPWVSSACPDGEPGCSPSLQHLVSGVWQLVGNRAPIDIDFAGTTGVLAVVLPNGPTRPDGTPLPVVQVSSDGGATWSGPLNPCGVMQLQGLTAPREGEVMVACGSASQNDSVEREQKRLLASQDFGATWTEVASTGAGLIQPGTKVSLDIAADGTGFWWGAFTPAMATADGGRTWTALDVADGVTRIAGAGAAIGGGAGYLVVGDRLMWTADGTLWEERATFPEPPCCGG